MNYKNACLGFIVIPVIMLVGSFGYALGLHQRPVYNRVSTSNHHSIEKAMSKVGIVYSDAQLGKMYRILK